MKDKKSYMLLRLAMLVLSFWQGEAVFSQNIVTDSPISIVQTNEQNPIVIIAGKERVSKDEAYIYIRIIIHPLYHIFAKVSDEDPYRETKIKLNFPKGVKPSGKMRMPKSHFFTALGTRIYSGDIQFRQKIRGDISQPISVSISYQACDNNICFFPEDKQTIIK